MRTRPLLVVLVVLLGCIQGATAEERLGIDGRVVDEAGKPVADYTVWAQPPMGMPREFRRVQHGAVTDAKGNFLIKALLPGTYRLHAGDSLTHAKFAPRSVNAGALGLTIAVEPYRTITGVVRDHAGKPLGGAPVFVRRMPPTDGSEVPTWTAANEPLVGSLKTDTKGRFRLERYPSKLPVQVSVHPPKGRERELLRGVLNNVTPGDAALELVAPKALTIVGHVRAEDGRPIQGARVKGWGALWFVHAGERETITRLAVTDAQGRFELRPFEPQESVLVTVEGPQEADPPWFAGRARDVAAGTTDLGIVLGRGKVIEGTVVGVPAEELRWLTLRASVGSKSAGGFGFDGTTNRFRLSRLPEGTVRLSFRQRRRDHLVVPTWRDVQVGTTDVVFRVWRARVLRGRVTSRVEPHRIQVTFHDAAGHAHSRSGLKEDGSFEIPGVAPGPGFLYLTACARGRFLVVEGADPTKAPLELELVSARKITGRILGLPAKLTGGTVTATRGPLSSKARVAEDGWFETRPLAPGPWTLTFDGFRFEMHVPPGAVAPVKAVAGGKREAVAEWGRGR